MCKHALCEHGKDKPEPPSFGSSVRDYTMAAGVVAGALALPRFGSRWVPYQAQLALACVFGAVLVGRALTTKSVQLSKSARAALAAEPEHVAWVARAKERRMDIAERLGQAIRIETVSHDKQEEEEKSEEKSSSGPSSSSSPSAFNPAPFLAMHALLERNYPLVHANLERTIINSYSLVFHWKAAASSSSSPPLKPYLLTAHLDVVPVADAHLWDSSGGGAFSGKLLDSQFVCGRGAIDDKHAVCAILEALEDLLATSGGKRPNRDLYVAFGHDEEIGGTNGAKFMVEHFVSKGLHFDFMLDEGLFVMDGVLPGVKESVAMVCIAEKGMVVSQYAVSVPPALAGHASAPGRESAIGILARALVAMESAPMPSYLSRGSPARLMFESVAPHAAFPFRFIFANLFLFAPVLKMILAMKNTTATIIRTTTALTVFNAGGKANVVPREASALINHRIHPEDSVSGVLNYSRSVVNDSRVKISSLETIEPAPVSSHTSSGYRLIQSALGRVLPDVLVAPAMMVGNTDTHYYWNVVDDIYRFSPTRLNGQTLAMFHGANERIQIDNYLEVVGFYRAIIQMADTAKQTENKQN